MDSKVNSALKFKMLAMVLGFFAIVILFDSCKQKNKKSNLELEKKKLKSNLTKFNTIKIPDTIYNLITTIVDGHQYTVTTTNADYVFLTSDRGDTIYRDSVYSHHQEFADFNNDGYNDVLISYVSNTPSIQELLLYDKSGKTYKKVIDLQDFPASQRLGNTKYYFSYHHSGCADMNWDSDLFYIEDYKTVRIGNIRGRECGDDEGIYIVKVDGEKKTEITTFPIQTIKQYKSYKFGFIKEYWKKHYNKFL